MIIKLGKIQCVRIEHLSDSKIFYVQDEYKVNSLISFQEKVDFIEENDKQIIVTNTLEKSIQIITYPKDKLDSWLIEYEKIKEE